MNVVRGVAGAITSPSIDDPPDPSFLIIDATEPKDRPYPKRRWVSQEVMDRMSLTRCITPEVLARLRWEGSDARDLFHLSQLRERVLHHR